MPDQPLLDVRDLRVSFRTRRGPVTAVDGLSFSVAPGEVLGVVGESGSGKSVSMLAVLRLLTSANVTVSGRSTSAAATCSPFPTDNCARSGARRSPWSSRTR